MNVSKMQKRTVFVVKSRSSLMSRRAVLAMFDVMAKDLNKRMKSVNMGEWA